MNNMKDIRLDLHYLALLLKGLIFYMCRAIAGQGTEGRAITSCSVEVFLPVQQVEL